MDFSIAICTFNRPKELARTLETMTVMRVPDGAAWEIVVINNNGRHDETSEVVGRFAARLPVREILEPRRGASVARNRALAECKGRRLLWTDDDVEVHPDWAVALLEAFDTHRADVVFGKSFPVWDGTPPSWYGPQFQGQFAALDYGPAAFEVTDDEHMFYNLNVAFGPRVLQTVGTYREDLGYVGAKGGAGEDTDMFKRILAAGLKIMYEPKAVIGHCISEARATKKRQRELAWQGARTNYLMVSQSNWPGAAWRRIPRHMFRLAIDDTMAMGLAFARRNPGERFYREIRILRFLGLVREAIRAGSPS
jgi:glucosyl-dolichyl phosphate glucuronosyltransferase